MQFDDRLATVLRSGASSETAARTQFRQLLDLLGSIPSAEATGPLAQSGYARLQDLMRFIPAEEQSRILREPGLRLRSAELVGFLAGGETRPAAALMATARLPEAEWLDLIPRLPITARGFLRHRRDLPPRVRDLLAQLGVSDLVLAGPVQDAPGKELGQTAAEPGQTGRTMPAAPAPQALPDNVSTVPDANGIGAIRRRIEAFQQSRKDTGPAPRLPLGDENNVAAIHVDFAVDQTGEIIWADRWAAPMLVGLGIAAAQGAAAQMEGAGLLAMARRQPLTNIRLAITAAPEISGEWRVDAAPVFAPTLGQFTGYAGRLRRPAPVTGTASGTRDTPADRMRQLLHELRTPVNAIQGFAEIIQQQLFGHAPNSYRALAASIGVDSARLLASFDEIDRLACLESGSIELEAGTCDWREVVTGTIQRLDGVLRPRDAGFDLTVTGSPFLIGIDRNEALNVAWRFLATMAGALGPGEHAALQLRADGRTIRLLAELPQVLARQEDIFVSEAAAPPASISAGMFGSGFSLRLLREEARCLNGSLARDGNMLAFALPALTEEHQANSNLSDKINGSLTA